MSPERLQELFEKYMNETISPQELAMLFEFMQSDTDPALLDEVISRAFEDSNNEVWDAANEKEEVLNALRGLIEKEMTERTFAETKQDAGEPHRRGVFLWTGWRKYGVAAALLLIVTGIGRVYVKSHPSAAPVSTPRPIANRDVIGAPGTHAAILTLADGRKVSLDSSGKVELPANQGDAQLSDTGSVLAYSSSSGTTAESMYNTLQTARAMQYNVVLSDGTRAWLNASSSIRYPVGFSGKERKVEVTGEVYFEVAPNKDMPFVVQSGKTMVNVLGTRFDIIDYDDEPDTKVALLQGSVKVRNSDASVVLSPGTQAEIDRTAGRLAESPLDGERVIAWTRNLLDLNNTDFGTLMRQIGRWYNVDIVFQGSPPVFHFRGILHRDVNLSAILDYLSENGVRYRTDGKTITIINNPH